MKKRKKSKLIKKENLKVNPELEGFDVKINSLGEIQPSLDIDRVIEFLDRHVKDKKLS